MHKTPGAVQLSPVVKLKDRERDLSHSRTPNLARPSYCDDRWRVNWQAISMPRLAGIWRDVVGGDAPVGLRTILKHCQLPIMDSSKMELSFISTSKSSPTRVHPGRWRPSRRRRAVAAQPDARPG